MIVQPPNNHTLFGTVGGTLLSIAATIQSADILKTVLLATVGALVSFMVSLLLKRFTRKRRK
jgi:mannitol-specific phosphotransferase system IIBC component